MFVSIQVKPRLNKQVAAVEKSMDDPACQSYLTSESEPVVNLASLSTLARRVVSRRPALAFVEAK
jgi:hypothetical protein